MNPNRYGLGQRKTRSDKQTAAELKAKGSWRAKDRAKEEAGGEKRPKVWSRKRPPEKAILDPAKTILLIPGYDPHRDAAGFEFRPELARRVVRWFHNHITHVKGDLTGEPYVLAPIEQAILFNLFGWVRSDGTRRYRKALVYVPRKFSKTTLSAGVALYGFFEEVGGCSCLRCREKNGRPEFVYAEGGVEAYAAAYTRDQAKLLWVPSRQMIRSDEELLGRCRIYQHSIVRYQPGTTEDDGSYFQAISADANSAHGLNPYIYTVDELHTQKTPDLLDTLDTGTGSRSQPLGLRITTADFAGESICNEEYEHAVRVRDGVVADPEYLPVIFEATLDDDPFDEETWRKANPKYPATPKQGYLESQAKKARENTRFLNTFLRLHLNIRTNADVAWFDLADWDRCAEDEEPTGPCFAGLDLAKTTDLTAFALYWPEVHLARLWFWMPKETARKREERDRVPYAAWTRDGLVEQTEGNVTDYGFVRERILQITVEHSPVEIAYDPWNATQLAVELQGDGLDLVEFRQGYRSISEPAKELERLVASGQLRHGGNPVLRWCASNVMLEEDPAGNIKPSKRKSTGRIDGIVALVMAIGRAIQAEQPVAWTAEVYAS